MPISERSKVAKTARHRKSIKVKTLRLESPFDLDDHLPWSALIPEKKAKSEINFKDTILGKQNFLSKSSGQNPSKFSSPVG